MAEVHAPYDICIGKKLNPAKNKAKKPNSENNMFTLNA
jgi:hypothetical protein